MRVDPAPTQQPAFGRGWLLSLLSSLALLGAQPAPGSAANVSWVNPAGGSASTASNWSPAIAPGPDEVTSFAINASYNVSWAAPADTITGFQTSVGRSRHTFLNPLRTRSAAFIDAESTTVLSGTVRATYWDIGYTNSSRLLAVGRAILEARDSLGTSSFGHYQASSVFLGGGARFTSNGAVQLGFAPGTACTLTVLGFGGVPRVYSALQTQSALGASTRGDVAVGVQGSAQVRLSNGGYASVAGDLVLGQTVNGIGHLHLINTSTALANPRLTVKGTTQIGVPNALTAGYGNLEVTHGTAELQGPVYLTNGRVTVRNGSSLTLKSLEMQPTASIAAVFRSIGPVTVATIDSTIMNDQNDPGFFSALVEVDSGGTLHVNGSGTHKLGPSGELRLWRGSFMDSPGEFEVRGLATIQASTLAASRLHLSRTGSDFGQLQLFDGVRVRARVLIDAGTYAWVQGGAATLGDSLADDGFVSRGLVMVGGHTLEVYDRNGAELGNLSFANAAGVLRLPQGGTTGRGDHLSGPLRIEGAYTNRGLVYAGSGVVQVAGVMTQDGGATLGPGFLDVLGGARLRARDSIAAQIRLAGALETGDLPARLQALDGLVVNSPLASMRLRIGQADTIAVTGSATIGGTLELRTWGPAPAVGSVYRVLTATSGVIGTFSSVTVNGLPAAGLVTVTYEPNAVKVTVVGTITVDVAVNPEPDHVRLAASGDLRAPVLMLDLPRAAMVRLSLFDVLGRRVAVLADGTLEGGRHQFPVPVSLPGGAYFTRATVTAAEGVVTRTARFVLLH